MDKKANKTIAHVAHLADDALAALQTGNVDNVAQERLLALLQEIKTNYPHLTPVHPQATLED